MHASALAVAWPYCAKTEGPDPVFEVKALLERYLANEALSVTQAAEANTLIRVIQFAGPTRTDVLQTTL